jgi:hypothetical protein
MKYIKNITEYLSESIYDDIPQPFSGVDIIGFSTFNGKSYSTNAYDFYCEQYDLPEEPILYIHGFFPKEEFKGKGLTKKYLLKTLSDWSNNRLENKELNDLYGKKAKEFGGSDLFATSSFYEDGKMFFDNLVNNGFLEKMKLPKKIEHMRSLNLYRITDKTKTTIF